MSRWLIFLCLSCAASVCAGDGADAGALAQRLVRAMNVAELSAMGLRKSVETMQRQGMTAKQAECARAVDAEDFVPVLTQIAAGELSLAELEEAIRFYESSSGLKYTVMTEVKSAEAMGIPTSKVMPDFTAKEVANTEKFGTTAIFHKLVNQNVLTRSVTGRNLIHTATLGILRRCGVGA